MKSSIKDLHEHKDRAIALDRALKFAVLFRKETFSNLQELLNFCKAKEKELTVEDLEKAITKEVIAENGFTPEELEWLNNYLKHSTEYHYIDPNDSLPASVPW
jgi:hypothetical protein